MLGEGHPAPARAHPNQSRAKRGIFGAPGSDSSVCIRGDTLGPRQRPAVSRRASSYLLSSRQQGLLCHSSPLPPHPAASAQAWSSLPRVWPPLPQGLFSYRLSLLSLLLVTETKYIYISLGNKT